MADTIELDGGWRATFQPGGDWLSVRLHPAGPFPASHTLLERLWGEIDARGARHVVVDMAEVSFLPSLLMGELVRLHKRLATHGGRLRLCSLHEHPREALAVVGLDRVLPAFVTLAEATA
ncbi:MAG: STAS domain-containing protein [Lacipirellulaceae bacterium]